jgi:REP element-mobilizing transposase RayT
MFEVVESIILQHHKKECLIYAYTIMANHAHVVLQPLPQSDDLNAWCDYQAFHRLEDITGKIKGNSARIINQRIGHSGTLWKSESFDRTIREDQDLKDVIDYVHNNPVRWKLVERPEQYRWSSAYTIYSGAEEYRGWFDLPLRPSKPEG